MNFRDYPGIVHSDFMSMFCGPKLGSGISRDVFAHAHDKNLVIKIEQYAKSFQNVLEWQTWRWWKNEPKVAKWLAPCVEISENGAVLIQKRTKPLPNNLSKLRVPEFFNDVKRDNLGLLGKQIVLHDYAYLNQKLNTKTALHHLGTLIEVF